MGCCGGEREKFGELKAEQKWEYINLNDFKSSSCWAPFAYGYLLVMLVVSISVYAVDTFTAINLLVFDRWAGQIKPVIPLTISRWIFAGCIILSFVLLAYRWLRAIRVMRQGGVAKSYLDPLAVRVQSIRWGQSRGWKRFLVFAELTKSRKGADYVALFAYFSFEAFLRIVLAEGPRQVVNAITLYSVLRLKLIPTGAHAPDDGHSAVVQFFVNVGILASSNHLQAVILFGMLWTFVIWVISVLSLIVSIILYLLFLWHHIPSDAGGLAGYCRTKINRRMERVVRVKVDKALKRENQLRAREEAKAARGGLNMKKQPTLPNISTDEIDPFDGLSRQTTMTTLPEYSSRPSTSNNSNDSLPTLPNISARPLMSTHGSAASWDSFQSNAPLIGSAGEMGVSSDQPQSYGSEKAGPWYGNPVVNRSMTGLSQPAPRAFSPAPHRPGTAQSLRNGPGAYQMDPLPRPGTSMSVTSRGRQPYDNPSAPPYPDDRSRTPATVNPTFPSISEERGRNSPLPGPQFRSQTPTRGPPERSYTPNGVAPRAMTPVGGGRPLTPSHAAPLRSMTPASGPTVPRLQTRLQNSTSASYIPYSAEPRSMSPQSSLPPSATTRSVNDLPRTYTPFNQAGPPSYSANYSRDKAPPPRQDSGLDDILDHY
ncbi:Potassium transporter [Elasticomyces elasticus]|uniref:Potassium transporter n=1 Tax=Exophiala sideris TaxID=1016849 RepID=A0ABR0JJ80_9EURO|nr:Potassium transporter [Elasticomyces elasticus]KAK5030260.1 Potassium transporter [Exophiala sideris]KAK5035084.1 Potassium transporter [Exophiala sideris]KAK5066007.1 Potassium transporter [Exophiala sideris]KAK5178325.1 Potassium transporter [Eurotiomycetes sp. CCFEE 6388]